MTAEAEVAGGSTDGVFMVVLMGVFMVNCCWFCSRNCCSRVISASSFSAARSAASRRFLRLRTALLSLAAINRVTIRLLWKLCMEKDRQKYLKFNTRRDYRISLQYLYST